MLQMQSLKLRVSIIVRCASVILSNRSLLFFPFVSMATAVTALSFFYFTVGPDKMQLMLNTLRNEQGVQMLNAGYYGALGVAMYVVVATATAMNFAMVACIRIRLDGEESRIWDGIALILRRIPAIFIWSLLSISLGLLWTLFDQERRSSAFLRRRFGNTWNTLSILTVPIAVVENTNVLSAVLRSHTMMQDTWGRNVSAQFGSLWFVAILSLPLLVKYLLLQVSGTGITLPFAEFALIYMACNIILAQTAKSIFKVILYRYAAEGIIAEGFDVDMLRRAFEPTDSPAASAKNTPEQVLPVQVGHEECTPELGYEHGNDTVQSAEHGDRDGDGDALDGPLAEDAQEHEEPNTVKSTNISES